MTISIWWLIGVSQITLGAIIACLFYAFSSRISKKQNKELKLLLEKSIRDYNEFAESFSAQPEGSIASAPQNETDESSNSHVYEHCLELYNQGLEDLPGWSAHSDVSAFQASELQTAIEMHLSNMMIQEDIASDQAHWQTFVTSLQTELQKQTDTAQQTTTILENMQEHWSEKKSEIQNAFDRLVKSGQTTDQTSEIHEPLNQLYNEFIAILNQMPNFDGSEEDALLKMEPATSQTSTPQTVTDDINSLTDLEDEEASADEIEIHIDSENSELEGASQPTPEKTKPEDETNAEELLAVEVETEAEAEIDAKAEAVITTPTELSPETIMPLSQYDLDGDDNNDDDLDFPATAIQDFEESETANAQSSTTPAKVPNIPIETELGLDDDIFDDLLNTMDEVLEENETKEPKAS